MTDDQIDALIEPILRAAGSSLRHFSLHKPKADMRSAMRASLATGDEARIAGEPVALTKEQRLDLLTAAFYVAAKDDDSAVLAQEDAERIVDLLTELSGFDVDAIAARNAQGKGAPRG